MNEIFDLLNKFPPTKWVVIVCFAILGTFMQRDMTLIGRLATFFIGIGVAVVFAEPIRMLLRLDSGWSDAVSALLALTGHNIADYIIRASKDPPNAIKELLDIWRGRK